MPGPALPAPTTDWPHWTAPPAQFAPGSGPQALGPALDWLEQLGHAQGWPLRTHNVLRLCADEALANIVLHARRSDGSPAQFWLACGTTPGALALYLEDDGQPFDPTVQAPAPLAPSLEAATVGGHGLRLMRHYLQPLRYRRSATPPAGRNCLLLEVALPAVPASG